MKHMNRLLFGLSTVLAFVIGCQKNPSPVRGKAGATEQCTAALTTSMKTLREANGKILEAAKPDSKITDSEKANQISAKAAVCADIVKTMNKAGTIDMADCTPAGTTAKITATEIKGLCATEVAAAKAVADSDKAAALKNITVVCSDSVKGLLQKLFDLEQKKAQLAAVKEKDKPEFVKQSKAILTDGVGVCNQLYPKMPDVCKATFTAGEDFKKVEDVKAKCQEYYAANTKHNKGTDVLPERSAGTIEAGTVVKADGAGAQPGMTLRSGPEAQADLAKRLETAKKTLEDKTAAKSKADAELETAKAELAKAPTDEAKKKAVTEKTDAAAKATTEFAAADKAVKDLEIAVKAAGMKPKVIIKAELAAALETEFANGARLKIENNSILAKVAIKNADEAKNAWTEDSMVLSAGEVIALKAHMAKNDKSVACRVLTTMSTGVSDSEVKVISINVEGSTDVMQAINLNVEVPGAPATPLSIQCVKFSTEQMKKAELAAALVKVISFLEKAPAAAPGDAAKVTGAGAGAAPAAPAKPAAKVEAAELPVGPTRLESQFLESKTILVFQDQSILKTIKDAPNHWKTTLAEITDAKYGTKGVVSNLLGTDLRQNMTGSVAKTQYEAGQTICLLARRGAKFASEKRYEQVVHRFEVYATDKVNQYAYVIMASKDAPAAAFKSNDMHETGMMFKCFKKSSTELMSKDDIILGLGNHFNAK